MPTSANRGVGRPSVALERRRQILGAFIVLVGERGLEHVSMDDVAAAAGVRRAALHHFVGSRDDLIAAAVEELCIRYTLLVRTAVGQVPTATGLVNMLFSHEWTRDQNAEDVAFDLLLGEAIRNPRTREMIKGAYDLMLGEIALALRRQYPTATEARLRDAAYVIACLVEQNISFQQLGFPRARHDAARAAALNTLAGLESAD